MRKPINRIALVFWIVGFALAVSAVGPIKAVLDFSAVASTSQDAHVVQMGKVVTVWREVSNATVKSGFLIALGVIIELVDLIRWNALPEAQKAARGKPAKTG